MRQLLILAFIVCLAGSLRLAFLDAKGFDLDEAVSLAIARMSWPIFVRTLTHLEANMSTYYIALRGWHLLGHSEVVTRTLSVLAGAGAVILIAIIGRQISDASAGLVAAFLLAINTFHIKYAQYARSYSLTVLLVLLTTVLLIRALRRPSWWTWAGYSLAGVVAVYSHFFAGFVVLVQWMVIFWHGKSLPWRMVLVCMAGMTLGLVPLAAFVLTRDVGQVDWILRPHLSQIAGVFYLFAGGAYRLKYADIFGLALMAVYGLLVIRGLTFAGTRWLGGWLIAPVMLAYLVSVAIKPVFIPYYLIVSLPAFVLLAALAIRRSPAAVAAMAIGALTVLTAPQLIQYYRFTGGEDFRGATHAVLDRAASGDAIVFHMSYIRIPFDYYWERYHGPHIIEPTDWRRAPRAPRMWVMLSNDEREEDVSAAMLDTLGHVYRTSDMWEFPRVRLYLLRDPADASTRSRQ